MANQQSELDKLVATLQRERDELRVKLHLAKADARDRWAELERQWQTLEAKLPGLKKEVGSTAGNVAAALQLAAEEIQKGYAQIRKMF
jgi:hypothetical protein